MPTKTFPLSVTPKAISLGTLRKHHIPIVPAMGRVFRDFGRTITKQDEFCAGTMLMECKLTDNGLVPVAPCAMGHLALQLHDVDFLIKKLDFEVDKVSLENDGTKYYSFKGVDNTEVKNSLLAYFKKLPQELKSQIYGFYADHDDNFSFSVAVKEDYLLRLVENLTEVITGLNDGYVPKQLEWEDKLGIEEYELPDRFNAPSFSRAQYVKECFNLTAQAIQKECETKKDSLKSRKSRKRRSNNIKVGLR